MTYENGKDIFPEKLLKQIQKYVSGKLIYIPSGDKKRAWGETSGYKQYILERNRKIRDQFTSGVDIEMLADSYALSCESIKKIVYSKKEEIILDYQNTLSSAKSYGKCGRIEEWIHAYLLSDGHNQEFSDGLKLYDRYFIGPLRMPLSLFKRSCGPEADMTWVVDEHWFEKHVTHLQEVISNEKDLPPLIIHYIDGGFEVNDGNHRLEAYSRLGIEAYEVIIWMTEKVECDQFRRSYGQYLVDHELNN